MAGRRAKVNFGLVMAFLTTKQTPQTVEDIRYGLAVPGNAPARVSTKRILDSLVEVGCVQRLGRGWVATEYGKARLEEAKEEAEVNRAFTQRVRDARRWRVIPPPTLQHLAGKKKRYVY